MKNEICECELEVGYFSKIKHKLYHFSMRIRPLLGHSMQKMRTLQSIIMRKHGQAPYLVL